ncbi:hypothetical protein JZ751_014171 [Albula glossodonta]|uniref:GPCR family 2 latrophilin C-terminal domain-containing protein n=1 Tax=Albula glossodonta TaxID=121402 RepID=A0A8T2P0M2_9TELE|nr:hypothetical protein JZ751_014171 [Albula glossodonta]
MGVGARMAWNGASGAISEAFTSGGFLDREESSFPHLLMALLWIVRGIACFLPVVLCLTVSGMSGNYLLTNPLLRAHGTNPYNTLLAETAAPLFNSGTCREMSMGGNVFDTIVFHMPNRRDTRGRRAESRPAESEGALVDEPLFAWHIADDDLPRSFFFISRGDVAHRRVGKFIFKGFYFGKRRADDCPLSSRDGSPPRMHVRPGSQSRRTRCRMSDVSHFTCLCVWWCAESRPSVFPLIRAPPRGLSFTCSHLPVCGRASVRPLYLFLMLFGPRPVSIGNDTSAVSRDELLTRNLIRLDVCRRMIVLEPFACAVFAGHSLNNAPGSGLMATLPLNGNFNNSYSVGKDLGEVGDLGEGALDEAALEKMIISELVQNNLRTCRGSQSAEQGGRQAATVSRGDAASLVHGGEPAGVGLGLEAPLLPQRTHSLLYPPHPHPGVGCEGGGYLTQLPPDSERRPQPHNPNRDSLYASLPNLVDGPAAPDGIVQDVYYMGAPVQAPSLQPYYDIGVSAADSVRDCVPEGETSSDGQMQLVTSL